MDALVVPLPAPARLSLHQFSPRLRVRFSTVAAVASLRFHPLRHPSSRVYSFDETSPSPFESSNHDDDHPEEPLPGFDKADYESGEFERVLDGEKSGKNGLPTTPSYIPSKEVLLRLRRNAELRRIAELRRKYNGSGTSPSHHPSTDLQVHDIEVTVPSWAASALTFAIAFFAGVLLAQFRGNLPPKNKPAVVDVRAAPSGISSVPYPEQLLGHFRAQEAPESDLKAVLADGSVRLRTAAADSFIRMQDAARKEGIWLMPISGFRSVSSQQGMFFDIMAERMQSVTERAKVSAPPGYSEHHTGYAVDIGDATDPKTYLRSEFGEGPAYRWLQENAARFHFELSFPKDNLQGIMYEPWHWRFVGDDHSLVTFYAQHKFYNTFSRCKT